MTNLTTEAPALYNPGDNNRKLDFNPATNELSLNISVSANPPIYNFLLYLSEDGGSGSSYTPIFSDYTVTYSASESDSLRGTIEFTLQAPGAVDGKRFSFFKLEADNGVSGPAGFEYLFTAERHDSKLTWELLFGWLVGFLTSSSTAR